VAVTGYRGSRARQRPPAGLVRRVSLHAGVVVPDYDRAGLERLCRYGARPAFAHDRLAWTADGRISYRLKRPWPDGRTHLVLEPVAFLRRLVGIIPPPRRHLVRYAGVFGPASKARSKLRALIPLPIPTTRRTHAARHPVCPVCPAVRVLDGCRGPTCCAACSPRTSSTARAAGIAASRRSWSTNASRAACSRPWGWPPSPPPSSRHVPHPR